MQAYMSTTTGIVNEMNGVTHTGKNNFIIQTNKCMPVYLIQYIKSLSRFFITTRGQATLNGGVTGLAMEGVIPGV